MQSYVTHLVGCLQALLTTKAEELGRATHFIQRQRRLTASGFAQTLIFKWMANPKTTMESMARELDLSPQALQQHLGPPALAFLRALLAEALQQALKVPPERLRLLHRFTEVLVEDTTVMALPPQLAAEFPGCGGGTALAEGAAALKVLIRWELRSGELRQLSVHSGRTSDQTLAATAAEVPEGGLHLADQGFFHSERWQQFAPRQYWISRVPAKTCVQVDGVWQPLSTFVSQLAGDSFDGSVRLVEKTGLPCRLIARRCPPEVAQRRRQKLREYTRSKKGREPSEAQLHLCDWLVFATNVPAEQLSAVEVWIVYRCRWQIELLFKRAKQLAGWGWSRGRHKDRILVELYAKLLGLVVLHWGVLLRGGPLNGISAWKRTCVVQEFALRLLDSLDGGVQAVQRVVEKLLRQLNRLRPQAKSRKKPTTRQLLLNPRLAA